MPKPKYEVDLAPDERTELATFISRGVRSAQAILRARILLKVDEGYTDQAIAEWLECSAMTVYRARKRYAEDGIASIQRSNPDREYDRKLGGEAEAHLITLACGDPPEGRPRWTLRLLADEFVALESVDIDSISPETVRKTSIKRTAASPIQTMGHPAGGEHRVRLAHGARFLALPGII